LKEIAEAKAPLTDELRKNFETMPNTIEELKEAINSEKMKADMNYHTSPQIIQQYEARKKEIEELRSKYQGEEAELSRLKEQIEKSKKK